MSVCLFVCYRRDTGRTVWAINIKLDTNMEPVCGMSCILFGVDDVTDDVIRSKSRSNFEIVITSLIFELEHRSKAQNVGHALGFLIMCSTSGDISDEKVCPSPTISSFWIFLKYSLQLQFDIRYYARKIFSWWWRDRWRHRKTVPLYSHINEKWTFFVITEQIPETSSSY